MGFLWNFFWAPKMLSGVQTTCFIFFLNEFLLCAFANISANVLLFAPPQTAVNCQMYMYCMRKVKLNVFYQWTALVLYKQGFYRPHLLPLHTVLLYFTLSLLIDLLFCFPSRALVTLTLISSVLISFFTLHLGISFAHIWEFRPCAEGWQQRNRCKKNVMGGRCVLFVNWKLWL